MQFRGRVSHYSEQGARFHQEDRFVAHAFQQGELQGWLLAVLDGHRGATAAEVCQDAIPEAFSVEGVEDVEASLRRLVATLDRETRGMVSGTTVTLACVLESHGAVAVAVLGDSPALVLGPRGSSVVLLGHNVRGNREERLLAERRGGVYDGAYLVNPASGEGLQMARALGDAGMGSILLRAPETRTASLDADTAVILCTDGVLDTAQPSLDREIAEIMTLRAGGLDARRLVEWANERGLLDNATAVVWQTQGDG